RHQFLGRPNRDPHEVDPGNPSCEVPSSRAPLGASHPDDPLPRAAPHAAIRLSISAHQLHAGGAVSGQSDGVRRGQAPRTPSGLDVAPDRARAASLAKVSKPHHDPRGLETAMQQNPARQMRLFWLYFSQYAKARLEYRADFFSSVLASFLGTAAA